MDEKFVSIGSKSIRKSNIKEFGIASELSSQSGLLSGVASMVRGEGAITALKKFNGDHEVRYLYVTTFQGDNHKFSETEIDIDKAMTALRS